MTIKSARGREIPKPEVIEHDLTPDEWIRQTMNDEDQKFLEILQDLFDSQNEDDTRL
jgi:hypothetical protein